MYIVGHNSDTVYQYTLSTGFDLSTASYDSVSFSVTSQDTVPASIAFNTDGTKMYIVGSNSDTVYQYTLSTGFDLSTASYDSVSFSASSEVITPLDIAFKPDGTKMYIMGKSYASVYQYSTGEIATLPTPTDTFDQSVILYSASSTATPSYTTSSIQYDANAAYVELDKTQYTVTEGNDAVTIESQVSGNIKGRVV